MYLNNDWKATEDRGALRCFPRADKTTNNVIPVSVHEGNLQVGWVGEGGWQHPVFLDCFRPSWGAVLYRVVVLLLLSLLSLDNNEDHGQRILSMQDFNVPPQPINFLLFLVPEARVTFEQISTSRLDPRFTRHPPSPTGDSGGDASTMTTSDAVVIDDQDCPLNDTGGWAILDVMSTVGTLVLFDSVTLPHLVMEVMGSRQRIAATGWFHKDSQFVLEV